MENILIVEDDASIQQLIRMTLTHGGYTTQVAASVESARAHLINESFDFAIVDIGLSGGLGYELVPLLQDKWVPFLFLTARVKLADKLYGIELGADDYMVKPFEPLELVARVKMILRRKSGPTGPQAEAKRLQFDSLEIDLKGRTVFKESQAVDLTPKEFDLLAYMASHPDQAFSRDQLLEAVWGYDACGSARTIDTHVLGLRQKLATKRIATVYKVGYKFTGGGKDAL